MKKSMRNLKLTIEYDGTNYCGWQVQLKQNTVMAEILKAIKKVLREKPKIEYASRTDSGVHAYGQVMNFLTKTELPLSNVRKGLNANLPEDIRVVQVKDVPDGFNARYGAKAKHYRYTINDSLVAPAINREYTHHFKYGKLDVDKMKAACRYINGKHDFTSFSANKGEPDTNPVKDITQLRVTRKGDIITIDVKGSGFLYKMVRSISGVLIEVGRGKLFPDDIKKLITRKQRSKDIPTAPSEGLCLIEVFY